MSRHHHLYNNSTWKKRRAAQLLAEPLCRYCLARGRVTPATIADHVIPHRGDPHLFHHGDLQSLCKLCHDGAKQAEEHGRGLRGGDERGIPLDPSHHWATEAPQPGPLDQPP